MYAALGSGFTLDGSGYRRQKDPQYIMDAREHEKKAKGRIKRGALIVAVNPEGAYVAAGMAAGGAIGGPPGAITGGRVGMVIGGGVTLYGVGLVASGVYHRRAARRTRRRGARQAGRAVRRDARRRS